MLPLEPPQGVSRLSVSVRTSSRAAIGNRASTSCRDAKKNRDSSPHARRVLPATVFRHSSRFSPRRISERGGKGEPCRVVSGLSSPHTVFGVSLPPATTLEAHKEHAPPKRCGAIVCPPRDISLSKTSGIVLQKRPNVNDIGEKIESIWLL